MSNSLRADGECLADGLRSGGFAGVVGQAQAGLARLLVKGAERLRTAAALVAAETDADDGRVLIAHLRGLGKDHAGFFQGEVTYGVEDPVEGQAQLSGGALAGPLQPGEDGLA